MTTYQISANAIETTVEASSADEAILAYVRDAGYSSVEQAAEVCGQSVDDFVSEITIMAIEG